MAWQTSAVCLEGRGGAVVCLMCCRGLLAPLMALSPHVSSPLLTRVPVYVVCSPLLPSPRPPGSPC